MQTALHRLSLSLGLGLLACPLLACPLLACQVTPASATGTPEAVRVGELRLNAAEIEERMSRLPAYQLAALGDSPASIRRQFVERFVLTELLLDARARKLKLEQDARLRPELVLDLARAQERELLKNAEDVGAEDVQRYYEQHHDEFAVPERIWIWRIVVDSSEAAKELIAELGKEATPAAFRKLARERSLDKATAQRAGDLGWVRQNGDTDVPQVRVDPALFAAARTLEDGEIGSQPVPEGPRFAVIWRRGTLEASARSLAQAKPEIVRLLTRERWGRARQELVQRLRGTHLRDHRPELIDRLPARLFEDEAAPAPKPRPEPTAPGRDPEPKPTERGLR